MSQDPVRFVGSETALHEAAMSQVGYDDFGDPGYREALGHVLEAYEHEARFSDEGRLRAYYAIGDLLAKRLASEKLMNAMPDLDAIEIRRPIIITGLVRTGSTALHHLLGHDPERQVIEYWLGCHPRPRPPRKEWESIAEYQRCAAEIEFMYESDPSLKKIHLMMADGAEECRHFLAQSFTDDFIQVNATVPGYNQWYEGRDLTSSYARHRRLLQLVGSPSPEKQWILKYPVHMKNLDVVLKTYPDACVIWTHRDPSQVMSSYISLVASFRGLFEDNVDRDAVGREQLEIWARGADRAVQTRASMDDSQFYDLHFQDFVSDPVASAAKMYEHFGLPFSDVSRTALQTWESSNPKGKHGKHAHSMEDVGLTRGEVLERFSNYMSAVGIEAE